MLDSHRRWECFYSRGVLNRDLGVAHDTFLKCSLQSVRFSRVDHQTEGISGLSLYGSAEY